MYAGKGATFLTQIQVKVPFLLYFQAKRYPIIMFGAASLGKTPNIALPVQ